MRANDMWSPRLPIAVSLNSDVAAGVNWTDISA
jgi:hypothetical protein